MEESHGIGGSPLSPENAKLYRQEYREGAKLFERALDKYAASDNKYQKEQYLEVMHKASQVLNDAARALKDEKLKEQNSQIKEDLAAFQKHPGKGTEDKLRNDLRNLSE